MILTNNQQEVAWDQEVGDTVVAPCTNTSHTMFFMARTSTIPPKIVAPPRGPKKEWKLIRTTRSHLEQVVGNDDT
jgi:hypothetical protein